VGEIRGSNGGARKNRVYGRKGGNGRTEGAWGGLIKRERGMKRWRARLMDAKGEGNSNSGRGLGLPVGLVSGPWTRRVRVHGVSESSWMFYCQSRG
jgi:hypothetical protein